MRCTVKEAVAILTVLLVGLVAVWQTVPTAVAAADKVYEGTLYISSMGGFFVKANVRIDPSKEEPIQVVGDLTRQFLMANQNIDISKKYYATHDARIDQKRNVLFWSAYFLDDRDANDKGVRIGKVDLASGKVLADLKLPTDPRQKAPIQYCGSGQTPDKYLVVMMGYEGWVDVVDKDTMKHERRVFLESPEIPKNYVWAHGVSSPDMKEFALWMSLTDKPGIFPRGEETRQLVFVLDMNSLVRGEIKVLRKATVTSDPKRSAFFRGYFTQDGRHLLLANRDRSHVLDAKTLKEVAMTPNAPGWENHDFFPTPDGKYAILTQRVPIDSPAAEGTKVMDGQIELYDLTKMQKVGKATSVCAACHRGAWTKWTPAITCGVDGVWKK